MSEQTMDLFGRVSFNTTPATLRTGLLAHSYVQHLRQNRPALREEWARRINEAELPHGDATEEISPRQRRLYASRRGARERVASRALQD